MWHFSQFLSRTGHEIPLISSFGSPVQEADLKVKLLLQFALAIAKRDFPKFHSFSPVALTPSSVLCRKMHSCPDVPQPFISDFHWQFANF
jgi:hypothetical protein